MSQSSEEPSTPRSRPRVVVCGSDDEATRAAARSLTSSLAAMAGEKATVVAVSGPGASLRELVAETHGASAAIVTIDSRTGLTSAARLRLCLLSVLGMRRIAVVADGPDPTGVSLDAFERTCTEVQTFAAGMADAAIACLPAMGPASENAGSRGGRRGWYTGPTLLEWLGTWSAGTSDGEPPASPRPPPEAADQYEASLVWFAQKPMLPGRRYRVVVAGGSGDTTEGTVTQLKHAIDPDTLDHIAARTLGQDAIGVGVLSFDTPVVLDLAHARAPGADFVIVGRNAETVLGAGRIHFVLRRSHNLAWQATDVDRVARAASMGHRPCIVWFTGLSGAGKSTIANLVEKSLHAHGCHTYLLDGDNVRHGLNRDLGFTDADRVENIRRVAEVARLMADAGLVVLVSFISPFRAERRMARALAQPGEFCEVFVDAPLAVAEARDVKGLYAKARRGELPHFTGIDSPYEAPEHPEIRIDTAAVPAVAAAARIVDHLRGAGVVG